MLHIGLESLNLDLSQQFKYFSFLRLCDSKASLPLYNFHLYWAFGKQIVNKYMFHHFEKLESENKDFLRN